MKRNYGTYSVARYNQLEDQCNDLENQLDEIKGLYFKMDDEEEAEEMYGEEIADLESQIDWLQSQMGEIDNYWLTRDYYASVL